MAEERKDLTGFYEATEAIAREVRELLESGALDRVVRLLRGAGLRLEIEAWSERIGQEEYLGAIEPGEGEGEERFPYEESMAERVEQWAVFEGGERVRVRMPDHVCPRCGHQEDNYIVETRKTCAACRFQW